MKRRDAMGHPVPWEEEEEEPPIDYSPLVPPVPGTAGPAPVPQTPAAVAQAAQVKPIPAPPNQRAPVAGSRFVDYSYLFGLNQGKAQQSAQRMAARAEAAAAEAQARLKGAQKAFTERAQAGSGTDYTGQQYELPARVAPEGIGNQTAKWGSSRQGLAGTPQRASPVPLTPEKVAMYAAQKYTGPGSLTDVPGYDELASSSLAAQNRATSLGTQEGLQALLAEDNPYAGGYTVLPEVTSGKERWDAAMLGTAGGDAFRDIAKRYGGLVKGVETANVTAKAKADAAREHTAAEALEWKGLYDKGVPKREPIELQSVGGNGVLLRGDSDVTQRDLEAFKTRFKSAGGDESLYMKLDEGDKHRLWWATTAGMTDADFQKFVSDMRRKHG